MTTKVPVHRRNHALIHIATARVTRTGGLRFRRHSQHLLLREDTTEMVQHNFLHGRTTRSSILYLVDVVLVFVVSYNYLRQVRFSPRPH